MQLADFSMCFMMENVEAMSRKHPQLSFEKGRSEKEGSDRAKDIGEDVDHPESDLEYAKEVARK